MKKPNLLNIVVLLCFCFVSLQMLSRTAGKEDIIDSKKTVLITGGAGFIGSNFLKHMFDAYPHYNFVVLDCLTYAGSLDNIPDSIRQSERFTFVYGSVTDTRIVDLLMGKAQLVVHFAAESHVTRSIYNPRSFFETDVIGTRVLLDSLVHHNNVERFIHISTSEVCGTAETNPMDEEHPIKPLSPYAAAKAGAELLVSAYQKTYDIPTVIIRPFNNYGPCQHLEKMIPRFITSILQGKPITVHGDGSQTRDWVHVTDVCRALDRVLHVADFARIKNQIIHIGSGIDTSVLEIAQLILKAFNLPSSDIAFVPDRPGQVLCHRSAVKKAKDLLDWTSTISLEEGLASVIEWYKKNHAWWKKREPMQCVPITLSNKSIVLQ